MSDNNDKQKDDKKDNFTKTMIELRKKFGAEAIMYGDKTIVKVDTVSSGIAALDRALGKGVPRGRIIEIYGPESSGKTTLCLNICKHFQHDTYKDKKGKVAFIDVEHALDLEWASNIGVDTSELIISQPDNGEDALELAFALCDNNVVDLIVIDSVAALLPQAEIDKELGDNVIGAHAKLMSVGCKKLKGKANKSNTTVIFVNQIRHKIGVMFGCLRNDNDIRLNESRKIPINEIVKNKMKGEVLSYNTKTKRLESSKITNWFKNGVMEGEWFGLTVTNDKGATQDIILTKDHKVLHQSGEFIEAGNLKLNDVVIGSYTDAGLPIIQKLKVTSKFLAKNTEFDHRYKYDLEIENNHNYAVGSLGLIVHNSPETTPGGNALKFYASVRMDIRKVESLTTGKKDDVKGNSYGIMSRITVKKNKVARPFRKCEFEIHFGNPIGTGEVIYGPFEFGSLFAVGVDMGVITKNSSHYYYGEEKLGNGLANSLNAVTSNLELYNKIKADIYDKIGTFAEPVDVSEMDDVELMEHLGDDDG